MAKYEKQKTKLCKHCQTEIPYAAKVCPNCRKKVKGGKLKWILIAILALLIFSASGGEKSDAGNESKKVGEVTSGTEVVSQQNDETVGQLPSEEPVQNVKTQYSVGDILQDGNMKIVYMSSGEYIEENEYSQPDEGYKYIYLQFAFINTSDTDDTSISSFNFEAYADGYAAEMYYGGEEDLSATLSAGRSTTGYIYFIVPEDAVDIDVEYETNFFTEEKIHFIYEGEKDSGYVLEANGAATQNAYSVGDIVESSSLKISYLSCEEYISDNEFIQPRDGYHFVTCEFEFENVGSSDEYISVSDFDCYADGVNCNASYSRDDALNATLSAGRKTKGTATFEVPVDAEVVEVEYLSNYWTSNRVVFTVD